MAFHGSQMRDGRLVDCSKLISCLHCNMQRWSKCTHLNCRARSYEQCNPFSDDVEVRKKSHSTEYRVPMRTVYYRSIILKVLELYKKTLVGKKNHNYLNYEKTRLKRPGCIIDMMDGATVDKEYDGMRAQFKNARGAFEQENAEKDSNDPTRNERLFQCSIGYTLFYDGVQNFERNADTMYPLICSVMNCNPTERSKLGGGMFLTALHNVKTGSGVEHYILRELLATEMRQLEQGIIIRFPHPNANESTTVCVYLQGRAIFGHCDTVGLAHLLQIQGHGSRAGCVKCGKIHGRYVKAFKKSVYCGHRIFLHEHHILRKFGQNRYWGENNIRSNWTVEKQERYYDGYLTAAEEKEFEDAGDSVKFKLVKDFNPLTDSWEVPHHTCSREWITNPLKFRHFPHLWYNYDFPVKMFANSLWFPTDDRRPKKEFSLLHTEDYLNLAELKEALGSKHQSGVKGKCPLVEMTKCFRIENITYDLMHYLKLSLIHI